MKQGHQLGPQTKRVERRYGSVSPDLGSRLPAPGGVNTEKRGASIPPWQFQRLVNIDWQGDEIIPRPGQGRLHGGVVIHDALASIHPHDFRIGCPTRLWHVGEGCPGESLGGGFWVGHYDQEQDPLIQRAAYYSTAVNALSIATYAGQPYVCVDDQLRRMNTINVPYGTETLTLAGQGQDVPAATFPGFCCTVMAEFDGLLYLILKSTTGGPHKIATWDGKTLRDGQGGTVADLAGIPNANEPTAFGFWRDFLVLGYVAAANKITLRAPGAGPGTWTDVVPGAGTIATRLGRNSIVSYKDEAYIASGGADLWNYDGTTLAVGRTIVGAQITCVEQAFGYLFYGYKTAANVPIVGRYDNTTYVDVHKDLSVEVPLGKALTSISYYRESIAVTLEQTGLAATALVQSPGQNTTGTWEVLPFVGSLGSNTVRYMVVL